ncbi:hypothetical protein [Inquilinus sp. CA228]|uniref:hypothetical protein n=1 Tax=Inquilinus sp. CA228 TaxID=3455609 RepID=UPI003F8D18D2
MLPALRERTPGGVSVVFPKDRYRLHAMVTSAGYDRCTDPGYDWHGLRRGDAPFVLLQHTIGGRGHLRVGRKRWELRPGQTMRCASRRTTATGWAATRNGSSSGCA